MARKTYQGKRFYLDIKLFHRTFGCGSCPYVERSHTFDTKNPHQPFLDRRGKLLVPPIPDYRYRTILALCALYRKR